MTPKRKTQLELTDALITKLFKGHTSFSEACKQLGLTRQRGYRLFDKWKQTEEARAVDYEWWSLYEKVKADNPEKALECLTRIKHKMIVEKAEIKQEIKEIKLEWNIDSATANQVHTTPETIRVPPE